MASVRLAFGVSFTVSIFFAPPAASPLGAQAAYRDGDGNITITLAGDALITRDLSIYTEPEFLRIRDLFQSSDVGFVNLEMLFHSYDGDIIPAAESGGTHMGAEPRVAQELVWLGVDVVSRANNHTMDYGAGGMRATSQAIEAVGIRHAGAGENLALARAPAYVETAGGRVALISVASTFPSHMRAGAQRSDMRGRPGLSPLRFETVHVVGRAQLGALREVRDQLGLGGSARGDTLTLFDRTFVAGDEPAVYTRPHPGDLAEILAVVRDARRQADWVIVTSHTHEGKGSRDVPPDFLVEFAHQVIDAGADVFTGHGPHILRGVEIYRGKPILYSLSDLIRQNQTVPFLPADSYEGLGLPADALPADWYDARAELPGRAWRQSRSYHDSSVAVVEFREGGLHRIRLHPVVLGYQAPRPQRGRPMHAVGEDAERVIQTLQRLSESFGTRIEFEDGIGVIHPTDRP